MKVRQMLPQRKTFSFEWRSWRVMLSGTVVKNAGKLALSLIMGLALLSSFPATAQAYGDPVDLELDGEGATSWDIGNIKPGDSGTKTVTLHNAGYKDGVVTIWISDVVNTEGANPEPETGNTTEPGELGNYLMFNLSCSRLRTNLSLPATIDNFPHSASGSSYIKVRRLNARKTIDVDWQWELPHETGNEVQGDSLSFTINYVLEELPSGDGGGGGSDGGRPPEPELLQLEVDMWGKVTSGERTEDGVLMETIEAVSPDGALSLLLLQGTRVLDEAGNPLDLIEVRPVTPADPPHDKVVIGLGYDFQPSCIFDPPIKLILHYEPQALADSINEKDLVIAYYDQVQLEWVGIATLIDTEANTVTTPLRHSSVFAMLAESSMPTQPPATVETPAFSGGVCNLIVTPSRVVMWGPVPLAVRGCEDVTVTADVTNSGNREGSYSVILKLNGHTEATEEIKLGRRQTKQVMFTLSDIGLGHHRVEVNGLYGEFDSSLWVNWWLVGGLLAVLAVIGGLATWASRRKKAKASWPKKTRQIQIQTE